MWGWVEALTKKTTIFARVALIQLGPLHIRHTAPLVNLASPLVVEWLPRGLFSVPHNVSFSQVPGFWFCEHIAAPEWLPPLPEWLPH